MAEHLTDEQLREFAAGTVDAAALLAADDHLAACESCRARAFVLSDAAATAGDVLDQLDGREGHLSEDDVHDVAASRGQAERLESLRAHLRTCAACDAEVRDLQGWLALSAARPPAPPVWRNRWWLAAAASLLLAALIPAAYWTRRTPEAPPAASALAGLDLLSGSQQARVSALLRGVGPITSTTLDALDGARETTMGGEEAVAPFALIAPVATAVISARPEFSWQALADATYEVAIFDERGTLVTASGPSAERRWTPDQPLPAGTTLVWQVTARTVRGERVVVPAAPDPPARFLVLEPDAAARLARLEAEHPTSHLLLGLACFDAGLADAARRHLEQVPPSDPRAAVARQALERLARQGRDPAAPR